MSNTSYYLYQKYVKYGSQDWIPVYPPEYAISGDTGQNPVIKLQNDPNCGYFEPEYRWHQEDISEDYICSAGTKYYVEIYQVSYDGGFTWQDVSPEQTRKGSVYESGSSDCIEYRWVNMDISTDWICDECPDYSEQYLTFIPISGSSTFGWETPSASTASANTVYYSLDSGSTWISMASGETVTVGQGNKIFWKSSGLTGGIGSFTSTNYFDVEGNIMSLLYGDNFSGQTSLRYKEDAFYGLFKDNTYLINAENLVLPATTLANRCYDGMFYDCSSLTTAPELPATTLANWCYYHMFWGCTSLTTAPELPATTLATTCYGGMFQGCTSLTTAPELPATTLAESCYSYMFDGCASLTVAPELPATTLTQWCYDGMFYDCSSLTTAPELPATTLAQGCYQSMFNGCTSLTTAPELSATTLADRCYCYMFRYCTGLTTAPELPATTLVNYCYGRMFYDCTNLNYIKCLATNISEYNCTSDWVYGVANSGTFVKASSMSSWTTGNNGIPSNWTIQNY